MQIRRATSAARSRHHEASGRHRSDEAGLLPPADERITAQHSARTEATVRDPRCEADCHGVALSIHASAARRRLETGHLPAEQRREVHLDARANGVATGARIGEAEAPLHLAE